MCYPHHQCRQHPIQQQRQIVQTPPGCCRGLFSRGTASSRNSQRRIGGGNKLPSRRKHPRHIFQAATARPHRWRHHRDVSRMPVLAAEAMAASAKRPRYATALPVSPQSQLPQQHQRLPSMPGSQNQQPLAETPHPRVRARTRRGRSPRCPDATATLTFLYSPAGSRTCAGVALDPEAGSACPAAPREQQLQGHRVRSHTQ
mmetsp:Transcript_148841/g.257817  ORF Transcript_148841/g.257817 Transcript_148841/m.257817 type:complete len:201 (+) Transcript_148841:188-790(+)